MQFVQPSLHHKRRPPGDMRRSRKPVRHVADPGLWQSHRPSCGSHRKKTPVSFSAGHAFLFHCHCGLQLAVQILSERRYCPDARRSRGRDHGGYGYAPSQIVDEAIRGGCGSISYTYTEPTVFFELAYDTAKIAHARGIRNVFVTNGYMTAEALEMIEPYLDAANVDLKAFSDRYYKELCGAKLKHVQKTLKHMKALGIFVEVTTLIVPGLNDDATELKELAEFIANDLGADTPWHISRFHPTYKLTDRPATPVKTLTMAREIGLDAGLKYVYTGNVPGNSGENTFCPACGEIVIERWGFQVGSLRIKDGKCSQCGAEIDGVWR